MPAERVLVGLSGKDAMCTLALAIERWGVANVEAFTMVLVRDLDCEWTHIRQLQGIYKGLKVHQVPHYELSRLLKTSTYRPYFPGSERLPVLKQADVERQLRADLGIEWIGYGMRCSDSLERNAFLKRLDGFVDTKGRHFYPVATWKTRDVYGYLSAKRLPRPLIIGGGNVNGGVSLDAGTLAWIEERFPSDFQKILRVFPFAGAAVVKWRREQRERPSEAHGREEDRSKGAREAQG